MARKMRNILMSAFGRLLGNRRTIKYGVSAGVFSEQVGLEASWYRLVECGGVPYNPKKILKLIGKIEPSWDFRRLSTILVVCAALAECKTEDERSDAVAKFISLDPELGIVFDGHAEIGENDPIEKIETVLHRCNTVKKLENYLQAKKAEGSL